MKTTMMSPARALARAAQGAGEHVSERTRGVRERASGAGNAAMRRISERVR
jgi:hypothetical protein